METLFLYLFYLTLLYWAGTFVISPFLIRYKTSQGLNPEFVAVDPAALPPDTASFLARAAEGVRAQGFETVGYFRLTAFIDSVETYTVFLKNVSAGDMAAATVMQARGGFRLNYFEFFAELPGGVSIVTLNCPEPGLFRRRDTRRRFTCFPEVADPAALYQLHRRLVWRHGPGARGFLPSEGHEPIYVSHLMRQDIMSQVECGYFFVEEGQDVLRPTWKGATLSAWKLLEPVRSIRRARLKSGARRVMAELTRAA